MLVLLGIALLAYAIVFALGIRVRRRARAGEALQRELDVLRLEREQFLDPRVAAASSLIAVEWFVLRADVEDWTERTDEVHRRFQRWADQ